VAPAELSPPPDAQAASDAVAAIAAIQAVSLRFMGVCLSGGPGGGRAGSGVLRGSGVVRGARLAAGRAAALLAVAGGPGRGARGRRGTRGAAGTGPGGGSSAAGAARGQAVAVQRQATARAPAHIEGRQVVVACSRIVLPPPRASGADRERSAMAAT
jgi:hypothetical protein